MSRRLRAQDIFADATADCSVWVSQFHHEFFWSGIKALQETNLVGVWSTRVDLHASFISCIIRDAFAETVSPSDGCRTYKLHAVNGTPSMGPTYELYFYSSRLCQQIARRGPFPFEYVVAIAFQVPSLGEVLPIALRKIATLPIMTISRMRCLALLSPFDHAIGRWSLYFLPVFFFFLPPCCCGGCT